MTLYQAFFLARSASFELPADLRSFKSSWDLLVASGDGLVPSDDRRFS